MENQKSIDFSRYLSMWLFEFHQPERDFWRFMNPRRFHALANAWYKPRHVEKKQQQSLSEYLTGG